MNESLASDRPFRRAVMFVCVANLAYFGIEFVVASSIGSVSLFADSVDFFEDAAVSNIGSGSFRRCHHFRSSASERGHRRQGIHDLVSQYAHQVRLRPYR